MSNVTKYQQIQQLASDNPQLKPLLKAVFAHFSTRFMQAITINQARNGVAIDFKHTGPQAPNQNELIFNLYRHRDHTYRIMTTKINPDIPASATKTIWTHDIESGIVDSVLALK